MKEQGKGSFNIICPNKEGHYGYYIDIIKSEYSINKVITYEEIKKVNIENGNYIILNFWSFFKKYYSTYFLIILRSKRIFQFIYNIDFLYKNNLKSIIVKLIIIFFKKIKKIRTFTLVEHSKNKKLGLIYSTDPILTKNQKKASAVEISNRELPDNFILLFGSHDERKGTYKFIKSFEIKLNLLIVGRIHDNRIFEFKGKDNVIIWDDFVDEDIKDLLFKKTVCVAIPYQGWFGSSGVLGTAISYGKVIIGSSDYFIGSILNDYSRGISLSEYQELSSRNELSDKIQEYYDHDSNHEEIMKRYFDVDLFLNSFKHYSVK